MDEQPLQVASDPERAARLALLRALLAPAALLMSKVRHRRNIVCL
jgi:hypothetical protein